MKEQRILENCKQSRGSEIPPPQQGVTMSEVEITIDEKIEQVVTEHEKYKVIMLNDNQTPMEWVVEILKLIFKHSQKSAENIMLTIHNDGSAIVGIYTYEIAEQKSVEATTLSRENGFPLQLQVEKE